MDKVTVIDIKNISKTFGKNQILKGVNLSVDKGESLVILGRSGSGKSVTIKCLVGLVKVDSGSIHLFSEEITDLSENELNPIRVRIGFMFQNGALYDSMSVRQNLIFTLKHNTKGLDAAEIEKLIIQALEDVGLAESIDKMPADLSGGMRKRIAMARSLIINPEIMLYDEPTSGLDTITSREIGELMLSVQEKFKTTSIVITHDMQIAKMMGKRIMILKDGVINAEGTYEELENSSDEWVKSFFI